MTKLAVTERSLYDRHHAEIEKGRGFFVRLGQLVCSAYGDFTLASPLFNGVPTHQLYVFEFPTDADAVAFKLRYADELEFID